MNFLNRTPNTTRLLLTFVCALGTISAAKAQGIVSYTPSGMNTIDQGKPAVFVLAPDGSRATTWSGTTAWKAIADQMRCKLIVVDGNLTSTTSSTPSWSVTNDLSGLGSLYNSQTSNGVEGASRFMVSYGTNASRVMTTYARNNTNNLAGIACVDASSLSSFTLSSSGVALPIPVIFVNTPLTATSSVLTLFQNRNQTNQSEAVTNGTNYYNDGSNSYNGELKETHFVRVLSGISSSSIPGLLKDQLLTRVARWKTEAGNFTLRATIGNNPNLTKITEYDANGSNAREAWAYIPSAVRNGTVTEPVPMVLVFHGITANGKYILDGTGWYELAEKYNFIAYAPTGNNWAFGSTSAVTRYSNLIQEWTSEGLSVGGQTYSINENRVYVYGFSNGSYVASQFAYSSPDLIAAAAPWAYVNSAPSQGGTRIASKGIPVWYGIGTHDSESNPRYAFNTSENGFANYFRFHANTTSSSTIYEEAIGWNERITTKIYSNSAGIEVRMSMADDIIHGNLHEHVVRVWEDFFSKYEKNNGVTALISGNRSVEEITDETSAGVIKVYPNPFSSETKIVVGIEETQQVSFKVYNIQGQLVKELFDNMLEIGQHEFVLDLGHMENGEYFYELTKNSGKTRGKLLLVK